MNTVEEAGEENKTALDYSAGYIVVNKTKQNKKTGTEEGAGTLSIVYPPPQEKRSFKCVNVQPFLCTENHSRYG